MNKVFLSFFIFVTTSLAHAEEVYNFYFEKAKKTQETQEKQKPDIIIIEGEQPKDMPTHWRGSKSVIIKRPQQDVAPVTPKPDQKVVTKYGKPKEEINGLKQWSVQLGVGRIKGITDGKYDQKTYALGARYFISRYFDVNMELQLPNGDPEGQIQNAQQVSTFESGSSYTHYYYSTVVQPSTEATIGGGVTPFHISIFGSSIIEIGFDGGVMLGNRKQYIQARDEVGSSVFLGPRFGVNFSKRFNLTYSYKRDTAYREFSHSSLTLGYRW